MNKIKIGENGFEIRCNQTVKYKKLGITHTKKCNRKFFEIVDGYIEIICPGCKSKRKYLIKEVNE